MIRSIFFFFFFFAILDRVTSIGFTERTCEQRHESGEERKLGLTWHPRNSEEAGMARRDRVIEQEKQMR